ncbi:MAG TPA: divalent cation tolerance protein CutA, partial [Longimicrobiales bacterium]
MSGAGPSASPEREGGAGAAGAAGTDIRLVLVTAPDEDVAQRLVETLVAEEVVACGNILPGVRSIY